MNIEAIFFIFFSSILIFASLMVVFARNPVHSVIFLILAFFNAAALFILLGAEFLAMILVIVYVGAVAVLFLFVVMMLDIDFIRLRRGFRNYLAFGLLIGLILIIELGIVVVGYSVDFSSILSSDNLAVDIGISNTEQIGRILYTDYILYFQLAGLILLVAMVGAIVLTLHHKENVKRQVPVMQSMRDSKAIKMKDIPPQEGMKEL